MRPDTALRDESPVLLEFREVSFGFTEEEMILDGFNLSVGAHEFVALLGPSGCGKSTLLNLSAGLARPFAGRVLFQGEPVAGVNRNVGYMTQGDTLLPWLTVARNVLLPLEIRRSPVASRRAQLAAALSLVDLTDAAAKYPSELSGGMKRRALLARSLIYDPPMLLMDEPFAALDAQLRETMHAELLRTVNRTRSSVLFVTHDISESILLADRILVLGGRPLTVRDVVCPPFGKNRDLDAVRSSVEYARLEANIRSVMYRPKTSAELSLAAVPA